MPGRGEPWREGGHVDNTIVGADVKDASLTGADIAPSSVDGGKLDFFKSGPVLMVGGPVPVAHGLGRIPPKVTISILTGPPVYIPPALVLVGVDSTVVTVTGSPGWIIEIEAL